MKGDVTLLREVPDNNWTLLLKHETNLGGEYLCFAHKDTPKNLLAVIVCPRCKRPGKCSQHRVLSERPLTLNGSFLCTQKINGVLCGYHGHAIDGRLTEL